MRARFSADSDWVQRSVEEVGQGFHGGRSRDCQRKDNGREAPRYTGLPTTRPERPYRRRVEAGVPPRWTGGPRQQTHPGGDPADGTAVSVADTFPKLLAAHGRERGIARHPREDLGIWQTWKWQEWRTRCAFSPPASPRGFARGMHLAVIGTTGRACTRPARTQALAGSRAVLQDAPAPEMTYVFQNAEIEIAIVEDQEQATSSSRSAAVPKLSTSSTTIARLPHYTRDELASYDSLRAEARRGRRTRRPPRPGSRRLRVGHRDHALHLGHDRAPKGVVLSTTTSSSPAAPTPSSRASRRRGGPRLPPHGLDRPEPVFLRPVAGDGLSHQLPESAETIITDMREIGPLLFRAAGVLEALLTR